MHLAVGCGVKLLASAPNPYNGAVSSTSPLAAEEGPLGGGRARDLGGVGSADLGLGEVGLVGPPLGHRRPSEGMGCGLEAARWRSGDTALLAFLVACALAQCGLVFMTGRCPVGCIGFYSLGDYLFTHIHTLPLGCSASSLSTSLCVPA